MKIYKVKTVFCCALSVIMLTSAGCKKKEDKQPVVHGKDSNFTFTKEGEVVFSKADSSVVKMIDVEIAETDAERQQGLMNRAWMEETQGMIFIFDRSQPQSFWMRNTIIPLDIIFVGEDFRIVSIAENTQPFSEKGIPSKGSAKYVVEVVAGFCEKYTIQSGDLIQFRRTDS